MSFLTGALALGAGLVGKAIESNAIGDAADTAARSAKDANALQKYMYDTTRSDNEPWRAAGQDSLNRLMGILSQGKYSSAQFTPGDLTQEPGYQFQLQEGQRGIDNSASARGGIGGEALKAGARFNQGLAGTTYQNAFNRFQTERNNTLDPLFRVAGFGSNVNTQNAAAGQNYANQAGANMMDLASLQGATGIARGNIYGNMLNQGIAAWNRNPQAQTSSGGYYGGGVGYVDPTKYGDYPWEG